ncbi:hypothetical protein BC936DRAFT_147049 [Jimgerdemannia flammicorona]|uniref:Glycosyltransferase 61 catalytic domain-containing protein n=1 Tax=Jimgerdemannia flammicorona TaxID=994334 RepID=A0A433D676_9FUNG|nr:hypothetical protein BC936DRAFT_147049 [Jimgerdemannia flammicorona]
MPPPTTAQIKKDDNLISQPPPPSLLRFLDFVLARHVLAAFILFFVITLAYFVLYTYRDDDTGLDLPWQQLDRITFVHEGLWGSENIEPLTSSWNCSYMAASGVEVDDSAPRNKRSRVCEFRNFCIDRDRGMLSGYIILNGTKKVFPPSVNIMAVDTESDIYWSPRVFLQSSSSYYGYINETVFVYGLYSPYHLSHWLFNGLIPLWSTMQQYGATKDSWLFRPDSWDGHTKPSTFDMSFLSETGRDIVFDPFYMTSAFQIMAPKSNVPICFARGVVGLSDRCVHAYCEESFRRNDISTLRSRFLSHYAADIAQFDRQHASAGNRSSSQHRDPIIALLNRSGSRNIPNLHLLAERLRRAGYTVQDLNLDHGLTLAQAVHLFRNTSILVASHGNALGNAIFMPSSSAVISVNARFSEGDPWFQLPMLQLGQRFYSWECPDSSCVVPDEHLAASCFEWHDLSEKQLRAAVSSHDVLEKFTRLDAPVNSYIDPSAPSQVAQRLRDAWWCYVKDVPRGINVDKFFGMIEKIVKDMGYVEKEINVGDGIEIERLYDEELDVRKGGFSGICRAGKCCGPTCMDGMEKYVFGKGALWGDGMGKGGGPADKSWKLEEGL